MERWAAKVLSTLIVFITMTIAGLLPIKVSSWYQAKGERGEFYISVLNCFGGGVFFGTFLMHMAPEVRHILHQHLMLPLNIHYPIPELAIGFGFFMLLFVDRFVTLAGRLCSGGSSRQKKAAIVTQRIQISPMTYSKDYGIDGLRDGANSPPILRRVTSTENVTNNNSVTINGYDNGALETSIENNKNIKSDTPGFGTDGRTLDVSPENVDLATRPYIFLIALSIDCIFEGMSLGLQEDAFSVWMLMVAILSHELVITFSFGLRAIRLFSSTKTAIIILAYTATIPLGVAIGFGIYESGLGGSTVEIASGFFQAIAAGIFIYITFVEILSEELTSQHFSMSKPIAVLVGFLFMAAMVLLHSTEGHTSGHSFNSTPDYNISILPAQPITSNMTLLEAIV